MLTITYDKYNHEEDYNPEEAFEAVEASGVFPEAVTLGILNEELGAGIGFRIAKKQKSLAVEKAHAERMGEYYVELSNRINRARLVRFFFLRKLLNPTIF